MAVQIGAIYARLTADAGPLGAGLNVAGRYVTAFERNAAASVGRVDRSFNRAFRGISLGGRAALGGFATSAAASIAGLVSLTAAINGTKAALEQFGRIADDSAAAALDPETFQSLAHQAELGGVAYEAFAGSLATFAKGSGLAVAGKGKMVASLKALNPELLRAIQLSTTQEQRVRLVADALAGEADASRRAAIATAAFGDAGLKLATVFAGGSAEIDTMAAKARSLGIVVSRDLIAKADEYGDQWDTVSKILDVQVKSALVNLSPAMTGLVGLAADLARKFGIALDAMQAIENRTFLRPLQNQLVTIENQRFELMDDMEALKAEIASLGGGGSPGMMNGQLELMERQLEALTDQALKLQDRISQLQGRGSTPKQSLAPTAEPSPNLMGGADLALLDLSLPDARELATVSAGLKTVTSSATEAAAAIGENTASLLQLRAQAENFEFYRSTFNSVFADLKHNLLAGMSLWNAFADVAANALNRIADRALGIAADGIFDLIFGAFSGAVSGGGINAASVRMPALFADGGYTGYGAKYAPAGVVHKGEYVFNADATRRLGVGNLNALQGYASGGYVSGALPQMASMANVANGNAGNDNSFTLVFAPKISGTPGMTAADLDAKLRASEARLAKAVPALMAKAYQRGGT